MRFARLAVCLAIPLMTSELVAQARSDTIVRLATAPRYRQTAELIEELSIGAENRGENYLFGSIVAVLPARDGTVWILVGEGNFPTPLALRRFSATGTFMSTVAIRGEGPGEFRMPSALSQLPDGRVLMRENPVGSERIYAYNENGSFATSWEFPRVENSVRTNAWMITGPDGMTYTQQLQREMETGTGAPPAPNVSRHSVARIDATGKFIDRVPAPDLSASLAAVRPPNQSGAYLAGSRFVWSPLGYWVTSITSRYAIDLRIPRSSGTRAGGAGNTVPALWRDGDPVISIRRNVPQISVSAEEQRDRLSALQGRASRQGAAPPAVARVKTPLRTFIVGVDGRIWANVSTPSERYTPPAPSREGAPPAAPWREPNLFDVFEPDGAFVGTVSHPYDMHITHMRGTTVWGIARSSDGVETVKRFRIDWR